MGLRSRSFERDLDLRRLPLSRERDLDLRPLLRSRDLDLDLPLFPPRSVERDLRRLSRDLDLFRRCRSRDLDRDRDFRLLDALDLTFS